MKKPKFLLVTESNMGRITSKQPHVDQMMVLHLYVVVSSHVLFSFPLGKWSNHPSPSPSRCHPSGAAPKLDLAKLVHPQAGRSADGVTHHAMLKISWPAPEKRQPRILENFLHWKISLSLWDIYIITYIYTYYTYFFFVLGGVVGLLGRLKVESTNHRCWQMSRLMCWHVPIT